MSIFLSDTLIIRSAPPVTNHSLLGSTSTARTQPVWPEITRYSFHGACHFGFNTTFGRDGSIARMLLSSSRVESSATAFCDTDVPEAGPPVMASGWAIQNKNINKFVVEDKNYLINKKYLTTNHYLHCRSVWALWYRWVELSAVEELLQSSFSFSAPPL